MTSTIVQLSDASDDDGLALQHAVALARASGSRVVALQGTPAGRAKRPDPPDAAAVLRAWDDHRSTVPFARRVHDCCDDPVDTMLDALRKIGPDLVVAASHRHGTIERLFTGSQAEAVARNIDAPMLLLPPEARPFVRPTDGRLELTRILVPVADPRASATAIPAAAWLAAFANLDEVEFFLLHVGSVIEVDTTPLQANPRWRVCGRYVPNGIVDAEIIDSAKTASLVVMATRGHDSLGDVLRGSHADRVLHRTRCPMLTVPIR